MHGKLTKNSKKQEDRNKRRQARIQQLPKAQNEPQKVLNTSLRSFDQQKSNKKSCETIKNTPGNARKQNKGKSQSLKQLTTSLKVT